MNNVSKIMEILYMCFSAVYLFIIIIQICSSDHGKMGLFSGNFLGASAFLENLEIMNFQNHLFVELKRERILCSALLQPTR